MLRPRADEEPADRASSFAVSTIAGAAKASRQRLCSSSTWMSNRLPYIPTPLLMGLTVSCSGDALQPDDLFSKRAVLRRRCWCAPTWKRCRSKNRWQRARDRRRQPNAYRRPESTQGRTQTGTSASPSARFASVAGSDAHSPPASASRRSRAPIPITCGAPNAGSRDVHEGHTRPMNDMWIPPARPSRR